MKPAWINGIFLLLFVSSMILSISVVTLKYEQRLLHNELYKLRASNEELLWIQSQLLLESGTLASYNRVQRSTRDQLQMRAPEAWEVLWLPNQ